MKKTFPVVLGILIGIYAVLESFMPHHYARSVTKETT